MFVAFEVPAKKSSAKPVVCEISDRGCWDCISHPTFSNGYPVIVRGTPKKMNRVVFRQFVGPIPEGLYVCHKCDNVRCVNPEHLFLGTPAENSADMVRKGRSLRGEAVHNAKLTASDVRRIRVLCAVGIPDAHLAKDYGISANAVRLIRLRKNWAYVA